MKIAALFACVLMLFCETGGVAPAMVAFVPLDDRPVTRQLPAMLATIAGEALRMPPRAALGRYLSPGDPEAILAWLGSAQTEGADAVVVSSDMLAYGGLVASRIPGVPKGAAIGRLRTLQSLRERRPSVWIAVFGTIMRLAPTAVPPIGPASNFFAAGHAAELQAYANLHDPPLPGEEAGEANQLRERIGPTLLNAYLQTRERNRDVDLYLLRIAAQGSVDRVVLGQDDAGPVGLHLKDVRAMTEAVGRFGLADRASIEPGADELGMALVAAAFARRIGWIPSVSVHYSRGDGASFNDPLEYAPLDVTINSLIRLCGARRNDAHADLELHVRVPQTTAAQDGVFLAAVAKKVHHGEPVALADLTFLTNTYAPLSLFLETLISAKVADKLDSYASWNTAANTVGTALAEAIAVGVGRRTGRYNALAHAEFMLDRYVDDYAFHAFVRPELIASLEAQGVKDHTYLLPDAAIQADRRNRDSLWPHALDLRKRIYPQYQDAGFVITLPWDRTFETELDVRLRERY